MAVTAREFRQRPSVYLPELSTWEAFCVDEACAHALMLARQAAAAKGEQPAQVERPAGGVSLDWLRQTQERFKEAGRYRL